MAQQHRSRVGDIVFHLAFPVTNIPDAKAFYCDGLGCESGRENEKSVILNLYGHQLVAHVTQLPLQAQTGIYPRHFGLVFTAKTDWDLLRDRAVANHLKFYLQPKLRFKDSALEHHTFFLEDPFHNLLEFKHYRDCEAIFGCQDLSLIGDRQPEIADR